MTTYNPNQGAYWEEAALDQELRRVFDICHGCRLCYNLCPSFPSLFDAIDNNGEEVKHLTQQHIDQVVDLCYQCKLCYPKCPYIPPHRFDLDFPRLMLRAKAVRARKHGVTRQDQFLGDPERSGKLGSTLAPLSNWANRNPVTRTVLEKAVGIHKGRNLPRFHRQTFAKWWAQHRPARFSDGERNGKVVLFYTCSVNYNEPEIGKAAVQVLEHNKVEVVAPEQRCCGMPALDGGDINTAAERMRFNIAAMVPYVRQGYDIVVPGPTCSYTLKKDYPLVIEDMGEDARLVAAHTYDICEYLMKLHEQGKLNRGFVNSPGKVAYHVPCHLKVQNIGFKSRDLLKLIPGAQVQMIDRCAGVDGTWGLKKEYFELSLKVADKLFQGVKKAEPDQVVSDCSLAGLQIEYGTEMKPVHPVQVLKAAYGLP